MGIFSWLFGKKPEQPQTVTETVTLTHPDAEAKPKPETTKTNYKVAGISYRTDAVLRLAKENPDWNLTKSQMIGKRLLCAYQYHFDIRSTELVPEPTNPHDPNAIKIVMDGEHIGYIKRGNCTKILNQMRAGRIVSVTGKITGGPWKGFTDFDGDIDDPADRNDLKNCDLQEFTDEGFYAKVTIVNRN